MLKYGRRNREVIENANQLKMTVDEFLALCKDWVNGYGELHRQYNLNHYPPAEYPEDLEDL